MDSSTAWEEIVGAFASPGIPIHVLRISNLRGWMNKMNKYTKISSALPSETTLKKLLEEAGDKDFEDTKRNSCKWYFF